MKNQIKGGKRKKRDIGETLEPVMQNGPIDYDELLQSLNENYPHNEKRYLGESRKSLEKKFKITRKRTKKN